MNVALHPDVAGRPDPVGLRTLSVCTGGGGLDLGFELAFPGARSVCLVEREAFAVAHLVSAMRAGLMAPAPVWSDARSFDGRRWRGHVDFVIGGIPCQPHSLAGKRLARDDPRDLWGAFRRIVVQAGAWGCVVENVDGMVSSGGFERVWRDLRRLGFAVEAGLFRASDIGAPHERQRIFILATHAGRMADADDTGFEKRCGPVAIRPQHAAVERGERAMGDAAGERRGEGKPEPGVRRGRDAVAGDGCELGDALGRGCDGRADGALGSAGGRTADQGAGSGPVRLPLFPPGPRNIAGWRAALAVAPELEPAIRRMADGVAAGLDDARIDAIRMLGNGVVPLAAGYALRTLWDARAARAERGADRHVRRVSA